MSGISKTKYFLLALIIIMGLIFFNFPVITSEIKNSFYSISSPVQKIVDRTIQHLKGSWKFLNSLKDISQENVRLEEELKELIAQNTQLRELEKENEFLRTYLKLPNAERYPIYLANVVGRDFQGLESYLLIDKGSKDGIKKDMPVVAFNNIFIGLVAEVLDDFSKVRLITSSDSKIPALIQESRVEGLIRGKNEDVLFMDLVAKNAKVNNGQTVIVSGTGGIFPKGLLIGQVSDVELKETEMFQRVEVIPATEIKKLERVFIITK